MLAGLCLLEGSLSLEGPSKQNEVQWEGPSQLHGSQRCDRDRRCGLAGPVASAANRLRADGAQKRQWGLGHSSLTSPLEAEFCENSRGVRNAGR